LPALSDKPVGYDYVMNFIVYECQLPVTFITNIGPKQSGIAHKQQDLQILTIRGWLQIEMFIGKECYSVDINRTKLRSLIASQIIE
jgi:hypothetical protein